MYPRTFLGDVASPHPCVNCSGNETLDFSVRIAFQPIVDVSTRRIRAYAALIPGLDHDRVLREMGTPRFQGFSFARPALEALPVIAPARWDALDAA